MSDGAYKRATRKHAARVDHTDGSSTTGFVLLPVGTDFVAVLMQASGFLHFETEQGEETYLNVSAIKRVTTLDQSEAERAAQAERLRRQREQAEQAAREEAERARAEAEAENARKSASADDGPYSTNEHFDALDVLGLTETATREEIQSTYRRLVKLYHPDRLRGLGVSPGKIAAAAEHLSHINNAYRLLIKTAEAA